MRDPSSLEMRSAALLGEYLIMTNRSRDEWSRREGDESDYWITQLNWKAVEIQRAINGLEAQEEWKYLP